MPLTHHPVRLFRLSCGCLREYPMMPVGTEHPVLCITCRLAVVTTLAYPERCCSARGWAAVEGTRIQVSCTQVVGTCITGLHIDSVVRVEFSARDYRLTARREGKTGRA